MNYKIKINNLILFLILIGFLLPSFGLTQVSETAGPPQSFSDIKNMGFKALKFIPQTLEKIWQGGTAWLKNIWNNYLYPFLHKIWQKIDALFGNQIEQRKPVIKEEFKKETQEMKQDIPQVVKSIWEKVKDFFSRN